MFVVLPDESDQFSPIKRGLNWLVLCVVGHTDQFSPIKRG